MKKVWKDSEIKKIVTLFFMLIFFFLILIIPSSDYEYEYPANSIIGVAFILLIILTIFLPNTKPKDRTFLKGIFSMMVFLLIVLVFVLIIPKSLSQIVYYVGLLLFVLSDTVIFS